MPRGIVVVGLGPGAPDLLTLEAQEVLQSATELYFRTLQHPIVEMLPSAAVIHSFDDVYERSRVFEDVYDEIASRVVELGRREEGVIYAVPGHPLVGEASVSRIVNMAGRVGLPVRIVEGLSFVESVCTVLRLDALDGLQIADAMTLAARHYPDFNPDLPLLIAQLYSRHLASDVKLVLMAVYPADHPATLVRAAGTEDVSSQTMPLYELDRWDQLDHLTSAYVPPLAQRGSLAALQEIVAHLRAPEGCPWDREQTHRSLRPYLLEEAYEVLEALDEEDLAALQEELGDLLLQVLLHTQIAIEQEEFKMADVVHHIVAKLQRRHPHVFGQVQVSGSEEVLANWEQIKREEKRGQPDKGPFDGIPASLPALSFVQVLQRRAARLGFRSPDAADLWAELERALEDLHQAASTEAEEKAVGNLLFWVADLARRLDVDAESAMRERAVSFERQFDGVGDEAVH
jgi:tetrapyrrole methylase family protein/MazG family protein